MKHGTHLSYVINRSTWSIISESDALLHYALSEIVLTEECIISRANSLFENKTITIATASERYVVATTLTPVTMVHVYCLFVAIHPIGLGIKATHSLEVFHLYALLAIVLDTSNQP